MPRTKPMAGYSLTTAVATIVENPTGSGENRTFELTFLNVDGVNAASLTNCRRAGTTGLRAILPLNYAVKALETVTRRIVLAPGDRVEASASANGDIDVDVQQIYAEPA